MKRPNSKKHSSRSSNKKILYLIRHGKTCAPSKHYIGQINVPLSSSGYLQAKYWNKYFTHTNFDSICSSTLKRAVETTTIISRNHNTKVEYFQELEEINLGKWDGLSFKEIRQTSPLSFYMRGANLKYFRPPEGGESFHDLKIRVLGILDKIIKKTKKQALIVSHAGVNRVILASILNIPLKNIFEIKQNFAAMNKILITKNAKKIISMNCTPPVTYKRNKTKPSQ